MRRRAFMALRGGAAAMPLLAALALPYGASAQQPGKVWRIGTLETVSAAANAANVEAFKQGMRQLGYVEGKNFVVEYRSADGGTDRFPALASELVQAPVDVIVTRGTPATLAAQKASATTPVITAGAADPLMFAASLARPGGNVTGLSTLAGELHPKRLEVLKELVPGLARIAMLNNMGNPVIQPVWKEVQSAAQLLKLESHLLDVRKTEDFRPALELANRLRIQGIVVGNDGLLHANRDLIAQLLVQHRLPGIYASREFTESGAMVVYGVNYPDLYRRAAVYVDKIVKGAKPGELPIEQPVKFELIVNLKTAVAIGLTIPESFLARADEVIE